MIQPTVYGQVDHYDCLFPILALSGIEGKMFHPMAMTVIFALIVSFYFVIRLLFLP